VARLLAGELGLRLPVLPWHTDRQRIVQVAAACAGAGGALGKIARDVTLLAQTEVGEVTEGAEAGSGSGGEGGTGAGGGSAGGGVRRGGSSAMPHKHNPVAAISVLGCTRQIPGLLATLSAAGEQEHQRAAGAWHAEWEPFANLLRLTGSAASWGTDLLAGLVVDPERMRQNLAALGGLPLAEHVSALLAPALGPGPAHDLVAEASANAAARRIPLREALLDDPRLRGRLDEAGVTPAQVESALDPADYLGSAADFIDAALAAHHP
jgi:3-carboxy-cis,cis-muconate cycloisomerase